MNRNSTRRGRQVMAQVTALMVCASLVLIFLPLGRFWLLTVLAVAAILLIIAAVSGAERGGASAATRLPEDVDGLDDWTPHRNRRRADQLPPALRKRMLGSLDLPRVDRNPLEEPHQWE